MINKGFSSLILLLLITILLLIGGVIHLTSTKVKKNDPNYYKNPNKLVDIPTEKLKEINEVVEIVNNEYKVTFEENTLTKPFIIRVLDGWELESTGYYYEGVKTGEKIRLLSDKYPDHEMIIAGGMYAEVSGAVCLYPGEDAPTDLPTMRFEDYTEIVTSDNIVLRRSGSELFDEKNQRFCQKQDLGFVSSTDYGVITYKTSENYDEEALDEMDQMVVSITSLGE